MWITRRYRECLVQGTSQEKKASRAFRMDVVTEHGSVLAPCVPWESPQTKGADVELTLTSEEECESVTHNITLTHAASLGVVSVLISFHRPLCTCARHVTLRLIDVGSREREKTDPNEQQDAKARERVEKVEAELQWICDSVLALKQKFDRDETAAPMSWCFAPETEGANVVGDATPDVQNFIEIKKQIVDVPAPGCRGDSGSCSSHSTRARLRVCDGTDC